MELQQHEGLKLAEIILLEKILCWSFLGKVTKTEFSERYDNLLYLIFLIFFISYNNVKAWNDFDKIYVLGFKKQGGPKMLLFNLNSKLNHLFLFFCMKLQHHKDLKLPQIIMNCWEKSCLWFFRSQSL